MCLGFKHLKSIYSSNENFGELYFACLKHPEDDYLFNGTRLCIPKCGTRELLIGEVHRGSLAGHFGENKTPIMLKEHYYWPGMSKDVQDVL